MADEVEMIPVAGAEPPKAASTLGNAPAVRKPGVGAPAALKPGLKLPPKPGLVTGLKLPPKPGATVSAMRPGLKLPTKPGLVTGLKLPTKPGLATGLKLPTKPVIRKPGSTVAAAPMPKPVAAPQPQPKPMETLKTVTQKLKGITQEIPQQAILHRTGIIADSEMTEAQKEAAKHKTSRISLADAMGVAPVKDEIAPMKTIRIKRPIDIPTPVPEAPVAESPAPAPAPAAPAPAPAAASAPAPAPAPAPAQTTTMTQRKTLKIARPGSGVIRPAGKFGVRHPAGSRAASAPKAAPAGTSAAPAADGSVAEIPDISNVSSSLPVPPMPAAPESSSWVYTLSAIVQFAACVAIGVLAWRLYENSQLPTFCGGLGWGA